MPAASPIRPDFLLIAELIERNSTVLDLGCGTGELMRYLEDTRGVTSRGIEIEPDRVMGCVGRGLACCQGDIDEGLGDFDDGSFDYVILSQTLHLVSRPRLVVAEMLRVARRGIVTIPNFGYWRIRMALLLHGRLPRAGCFRKPWYDTPTGHVMTLRDFKGFCAQNDIAIEAQRFVAADSPLARLRARLLPNLFAQLGVYLVARQAGPIEPPAAAPATAARRL